MKLQNLAVIFVIIIMPISLLLSEYTQNRIQTLNLQAKYDTKLIDATYDALKAYQLNTFNSDTSDYTNSRIRDVEAAANTFFNSMSSGFSELGYSKNTLQNYVPALVFTMNDGYYIYSNYTNYWGNQDASEMPQDQHKYSDGQEIYGLRPYVFYSCRYKDNNGNFDVTITYSLDNYVQIQGWVLKDSTKKTVSQYGYVLDGIEKTANGYSYRGVEITKETASNIREKVLIEETNGDQDDVRITNELPYIKLNGTKYYKEGNEVFSVIKNKKIVQNPTTTIVSQLPQQVNYLNNNENLNALSYYEDAYNLKTFINTYLKNLKVNDAVDEDGNYYTTDNPSPYTTFKISADNKSDKIFDYDNSEKADSNFNTHRREVIKHSIEKNLTVAISNYNASPTDDSTQSINDYDYRMPKLKETDWDKILNNISIISFLQGMKIGDKAYNGYTVVTNTQNEDLVAEDSIYIKNDNTLYRVTDNTLKNVTSGLGVLNINTERKPIDVGGNVEYIIPVSGELAYSSIVTHDNSYKLQTNETISDYVQNNLNAELQKIYFTALGRERQGLYRERLQINP